MDDVPSSSQPWSEAVQSRLGNAAVADAEHRRSITLVLGMHRSGTSLCSRILSVLGVDMADDVGAGEGNERGHWERWEIVTFHDRIFDLFNRSYYSSFHDFPLPAGWWAEPQVGQIRREIVTFLKGRMDAAPFGFKDPRTIRLLPLWWQIFADLRLTPRIVLCLRNPAQVARSLHKRDGLDPAAGEYRWLVYMADFFRVIEDIEYCTVQYETWFDDFHNNAGKLTNFLNIEWSGRSSLDDALREIIDPELRHDGLATREAKEPLVRQFYQLAVLAGQDRAARREVCERASQLASFERSHRVFHRAYEAVAERVPAVEAELAGLRDAAAEGAAALGTTEAALADARAAVAAQQARMEEIAAEREAEVARGAAAEAALADARAALAAQQVAELIERHQATARAEEDARAHAAAEDMLRDDVRRLQKAAATLEQENRERADEAGRARRELAGAAALEQVLRDELLLLRQQSEIAAAELAAAAETLARTEAAAQQSSREAAAARTEVASLHEALHEANARARDALARAEDHAHRRTEEVEARRAEAASLHEQLEASRQVASRLIAAFRADLVPAPEPIVVRRRWWRAAGVFLGRPWVGVRA